MSGKRKLNNWNQMFIFYVLHTNIKKITKMPNSKECNCHLDQTKFPSSPWSGLGRPRRRGDLGSYRWPKGPAFFFSWKRLLSSQFRSKSIEWEKIEYFCFSSCIFFRLQNFESMMGFGPTYTFLEKKIDPAKLYSPLKKKYRFFQIWVSEWIIFSKEKKYGTFGWPF